MLDTSKYRQLASDLQELEDDRGSMSILSAASTAILELVKHAEIDLEDEWHCIATDPPVVKSTHYLCLSMINVAHGGSADSDNDDPKKRMCIAYYDSTGHFNKPLLTHWTELPDSVPEAKIYAVDFDGYLCEEKWPDIGAPHLHIIEHFKALKAQGHKLILWTCREGPTLTNAVNWCMAHGLYFDAVNENLPERIAKYGNDTRKLGADFYCDDKNYPLMP